jgi:hypothetical protein
MRASGCQSEVVLVRESLHHVANFGQRHIFNELSVSIDNFQHIGRMHSSRLKRIGISRDGHKVSALILNKRKNPALRSLSRIGNRVFINVAPLTVDLRRRDLIGELLSVAVTVLKKRATHTEADIRSAPMILREKVENVSNGLIVHAVALNNTNVIQNLEASLVVVIAESIGEKLDCLQHGRLRIAAVGANHDGRAAINDLLPKLLAPDFIDGMVDVVAVRNHSEDRAFFSESLDHILVGIRLAVATPARHRAVFGSGNAEAGHEVVIIFLTCEDRRQRVRALEVHKMREPAETCGLKARNASCSEIVKLERKLGLPIVGRGDQRFADQIANVPRDRRDRDRIPDAKKRGLDEGWKPGKGWIGVRNREKRVLGRNDRALFHSSNFERKITIVIVPDFPERVTIERKPVCGESSGHHFDILKLDRLAELLLQDCLKPEEERAIIFAAATFEIGESLSGAGRKLKIMAVLVAVLIENRVHVVSFLDCDEFLGNEEVILEKFGSHVSHIFERNPHNFHCVIVRLDDRFFIV